MHTILDRLTLRNLLESDDPDRGNILEHQVVVWRILYWFSTDELLPELKESTRVMAINCDGERSSNRLHSAHATSTVVA